MKAVILAGGRGTRGRPFTDYIPKAMIPVQGRPLIYHVVRYLSKFDIIDSIIILGDFSGIGKQIEKYFENHISLKKPIKFYGDLSESASHWLEKKFYTQLGNEERGHMLMLKDAESYYTDPVHWFSAKERSHWDGA